MTIKEDDIPGKTPDDWGSIKYTVSWTAPVADADIRVVGITACLAQPASPAPDDQGWCLTKGMTLPASAMKEIARVPAASRSVSWVWPASGEMAGAFAESATDTYYALVIGAINAAGQSKFTIVATGSWCGQCTY